MQSRLQRRLPLLRVSGLALPASGAQTARVPDSGERGGCLAQGCEQMGADETWRRIQPWRDAYTYVRLVACREQPLPMPANPTHRCKDVHQLAVAVGWAGNGHHTRQQPQQALCSRLLAADHHQTQVHAGLRTHTR